MEDRFHFLSPLDYRYWDEQAASYLSEEAFIRTKARVEAALARALAKRQLCSPEIAEEIAEAANSITPEEVYEEERRVKHDIRALANCIRERVSEEAKPFVHLGATSFDIADTANAARFRDAVSNLLVPRLLALEGVLADLALRHADTVQIGRTHGQHAVPLTFGFAVAEYVNRLGESIQALSALAEELPGKFAGAVGAYNASSLLVEDPEEFEREILAEFGLRPASHATQIVPPEAMVRLLSETVIVAGVMANCARDMRHLQRTEIGEVGEAFREEQVGSSTMPQKRNPVAFEHVESVWKVLVGRLQTVYLDQVSEHQRDLTNSASQRTEGEIIAYASSMASRLKGAMETLEVNPENLKRNLEHSGGAILAEPLYVLLASLGHPDAHEKVRQLTLRAQKENVPLSQIAERDEELAPYFERMTERQRAVLSDPAAYTGLASKNAKEIAERWKKEFSL